MRVLTTDFSGSLRNEGQSLQKRKEGKGDFFSVDFDRCSVHTEVPIFQGIKAKVQIKLNDA